MSQEKIHLRQFAEVSITFTLILLYTYAGISKLIEYPLTLRNLLESPILKPIAPGVAIAVPILELLTVIGLALPTTRLRALRISLCLMTVFTLYIIGILCFSKNLPCSCGGVIRHLSWPQHVVFNLVIIVLNILAIRCTRPITSAPKTSKLQHA